MHNIPAAALRPFAQLPPLEHEPPYFEEILEINQWKTRPDAVGARLNAGIVGLLAAGGLLLLALLVWGKLAPAGLFALG